MTPSSSNGTNQPFNSFNLIICYTNYVIFSVHFRCLARIFISIFYGLVFFYLYIFFYWVFTMMPASYYSIEFLALCCVDDQLTMTKTFRQQNVRLMLQIELRVESIKISPKVLSASSINSLPSISTATHFSSYRVLVSIVSSAAVKKRKWNSCALWEIMEKHKFSHLAMQ